MGRDRSIIHRSLFERFTGVYKDTYTARLFAVDEAYQLALYIEKQQTVNHSKSVRDWRGV